MKFTAAQLKRWQQSPADFIETQLVDPVTNKPFVLLPAERAFIERAFEIDEKTGRLRHPEMVYATPRKGGKTGFAAMMMLTMVLSSTFDELWGFVSERSRRLWDEMSTSPVRKISGRGGIRVGA